MRKIFQRPDFILAAVFIPLIVLAFNCVSYAYFLSRVLILPNGVNYFFANRFWKYVLVAAAASYLFLYLSVKTQRKPEFNFSQIAGKISGADLLLILLPLTPVVQYIIVNQSVLSLLDALSVLFIFILLAGLYIYLIPALLGILSSTRVLMLSGLAFVFTLTSMPLLSQHFAWYESGNLLIQAGFFGGTFITLWLLCNTKSKRILYLMIGGIFLINTGIQLINQDPDPDHSPHPGPDQVLLSVIDGKEPILKPNIYLLIYDGYVASETLFMHGIDNTPQEKYLADQGFDLYPQTYSIGAGTLTTMSGVLDISSGEIGTSRRSVSGQGLVHTILKENGYLTYGLFTSDFFFRGSSSAYDISIPAVSSPPDQHLVNAILMGEFRFDLGFDYQTRDQFLASKKAVLADLPSEPAFLYIHSDLPNHSQNSGACLFYETETYEERLRVANAEMVEDLEAISSRDPEALIIIAGDHGPYLTKNCTETEGEFELSEITRLDIQDRYGTFLAIKWPIEDHDLDDEITVLQDLFPVIFSYLYQDRVFLEEKIEPRTISPETISGASVNQGVISGGIDDGEFLFLSGRE